MLGKKFLFGENRIGVALLLYASVKIEIYDHRCRLKCEIGKKVIVGLQSFQEGPSPPCTAVILSF